MKGKIAFFVSIFFLFVVGVVWAQNVTPEDVKRGYVAGEILVKFKPGVSEEKIEQVIKKYNLKKLHYFRLINAFHFKTKEDVFKMIKILKKTGLVLYAEPNYVYKATLVPNDPRWSELWGMAKIQMPDAWDTITGGDVVIADVDTGIDYYHEDLRNNLWVNPGEDINHDGVPEISDLNGIDDDGNGYVDDLIGWNFVNDTNDPYDETTFFNPGHGTHTAGTIGAVGNNGVGVVGVNWHVKIMALKFLNLTC
jgi:subtilisin family serine protease